jgi:hypothetical protein
MPRNVARDVRNRRLILLIVLPACGGHGCVRIIRAGHIGRDTLCLVRRGAIVTGLDFSSAALNVARRLSDETGLKADFVEGTIDQAPDLTPGPFVCYGFVIGWHAGWMGKQRQTRS